MNRKNVASVCLALIALLVTLVEAQAQDKVQKTDPKAVPKINPKELKKPEPAEVKDKLIQTGVLPGQLVELNREGKTFTLRVTLRIPVPDLDVAQEIVGLQAQLALAARSGDIGTIQDLQAQIVAQYQSLYSFEEKEEDIALESIPDVKVRRLRLPPVFDAKGKPRKYSFKELANLKGLDKLPGFQAQWNDVEQDQVVQVQLVKKKSTARTKEEKRKELLEPPKVAVILILPN